MRCLGAFHDVSIAVKRYIDGLQADDAFRAKFPSGTLLMPPFGCTNLGPISELTGNGPCLPQFLGNKEIKDETDASSVQR